MLPTGPLAYVDPMTGTIILQLLVAGAVGALAFFRRSVWAVVRSVLRVRRPGKAPDDGSSR